MAGGAGGPAVSSGNPDASILWKMIDSGKMPLSGEGFEPAETQLIRYWIERGRFPSLEAARDENQAAKISDEARSFWSFKKPVVAPTPTVENSAQVQTPIDAFVLEQLEAKGWKLSPDADRKTLIRRVYLDLVGLLPTPEQSQAFIEDPSPRAYENLIDRLLDSPHYGERWGRHWLDVAGYSDSVGNAADELRPNSWEYRDWVIRALNEDKPYDQFLTEQLAGDQLVNYEPGTKPKPEQVDALIATGFLRVPPDITDTQSIYQVDKWYDALQTTVETSMKATMGLTVGCAKCHDHKFDPILQEDYYRLTAIYQSVWDPENWLPAAIGFGEWPTRYILDADKAERDTWIEAVSDKDRYRSVRNERRALAASYEEYRVRHSDEMTAKTSAGVGDALAARGAEISDQQLELLYPELAKIAAAAKAKLKAYDDLTPRRIWAAWDLSKEPSPTYMLLRGNYLTPGPQVEPGILAVLDDPQDRFQFPEPKPEWNHTGRRLTLARWLTQPDHPLTARLMVNRVWLYHFGEGIVRTPDDFGVMGARPTHPELLDWLAMNFVKHGWSLKSLHRQIMLSSVYRQSSAEDSERFAADPSNKLLWRKTPLRLEAEVIRDSILSIADELDPTMYGKYEPLTRALDGEWVIDIANGGKRRRSLYILNRRSGYHGFLQTFDAPPMDNGNMPQRFRSALPAQSLAQMNSPFVVEMAGAFAQRVFSHGITFDERVEKVFQLAYGRPASQDERTFAHGYLEARPDDVKAWSTFCQAVLGSNQFLYSY